ncbi:Enamine deaminase RidA, house cleaning of reactive enamine intermediates, YjgF/YER057c/UK114 family [Oryzisolibacter propanilivorax]|uniref:Enamine deaminase RidA, house cleaning of reactive enamine intermediates, YjgF/YER057c/UK114 family n=2 Tax=Oryzisolibacter propanilivorax TaxID=1527607 RepID=A0A1G9U944_9BURK|nr:Enamine deaminase RidA, house cleaning of reactive enamine intermediates, YjgF/YER057c/UK114 family [Oryzisolibacter propanilivorax]
MTFHHSCFPMSLRALAAAAALSALAGCAAPPASIDVVRHRTPGSDFPIAAAVEVPPGATTVYLSGQVPPVVDAARPASDPLAYGDTRTQTLGVLRGIEERLRTLGLNMGDIVKMQVFLVADPKRGAMDFAGFMQGYTQHFGTAAQPRLPVRSVFQVAALANPGWLVEIEVTAVRPPAGAAPR